MQVVIQGRRYEQVEEMTLEKIRHLIRMVIDEIRYFERRIHHYSKYRLQNKIIPMIDKRKQTHQELLELHENKEFDLYDI